MGKHNLHVEEVFILRVSFFAHSAAERDKCLSDIEREVIRVAHRKVLEKRYKICGIEATVD